LEYVSVLFAKLYRAHGGDRGDGATNHVGGKSDDSTLPGRKRSWFIALVTLIIAHNCTYLWTRKRAQYERRAEATEQLLQACRRNSSKIRIDCFPYSRWICAVYGRNRSATGLGRKHVATYGPEETTIIVED
jgi:hypothetical protein